VIRGTMTVLQHPSLPVTRSPILLGADTLTVFDLEFTAWECSMASHWLRPGEFKEVIQIGAVRLDAASFQILDAFEILVRPLAPAA
jgi:inhibitor of KinA sporulation pathway (predicted exonuclease)